MKDLKLLVSVLNMNEAIEAVEGGADIIDVKNPAEGALGANFPWIIREISTSIRSRVEVSATLGDLPYLPGTSSLAALGAVTAGAKYVKAGLFGVKDADKAVRLLSAVRRAVRESSPEAEVIAAGYADYALQGCLNPLELPTVATWSEVDGVMIDVKTKDGLTLFDHLTFKQLLSFTHQARDLGLTVALAGCLKLEAIPQALKLEADILGFRRAACLRGEIHRSPVRELSSAIKGCDQSVHSRLTS